MTPKPEISKAGEFLTEHVVTVFETMLSVQVAPLKKSSAESLEERVTGTAGFGGEGVRGVLYLHLSTTTANRFAAIMLGLADDVAPADGDVNDVIGEMTNMLTGGLKSWLTNSGFPCAISTPGIIRGTSYVIDSPPEVESQKLVFESAAGPVAVEIQMQFD
ncbi:MAG TPA: chemotaxis protein CheX [Verrucomicrobiae bacterium]|nr:chemotaxis protein CheX [Verrucomicrobiae bacterium]